MKPIKKVSSNSLLEQHNAIGTYLDDLLHDATTESQVLERVELQPLPDLNVLPAGILKSTPEIPVLELDVVPVANNVTGKIVEVDDEQVQRMDELFKPQLFPLQCLMFKVGDQLLSIPLVQMSGVLRWPKNITELPLSPDWLVGVIKHRQKNLKIVDSAKVLGIHCDADSKMEYILALDDGEWAISCTEVETVVYLKYEDVQWRRYGSNPLSPGTIRESLAYLLSAQGIVDLLIKA